MAAVTIPWCKMAACHFLVQEAFLLVSWPCDVTVDTLPSAVEICWTHQLTQSSVQSLNYGQRLSTQHNMKIPQHNLTKNTQSHRVWLNTYQNAMLCVCVCVCVCTHVRACLHEGERESHRNNETHDQDRLMWPGRYYFAVRVFGTVCQN